MGGVSPRTGPKTHPPPPPLPSRLKKIFSGAFRTPICVFRGPFLTETKFSVPVAPKIVGLHFFCKRLALPSPVPCLSTTQSIYTVSETAFNSGA